MAVEAVPEKKTAATGISRDGQGRRLAFKRDEDAPDIADYIELLGIGKLPAPALPDRTWFRAILGIEALANVVALGAEADLKCRHNCASSGQGAWLVLDGIFAIVFVIDVAVVIIAIGPRKYFLGNPRTRRTPIDVFHVVDIALVFLRLLDVIILATSGVESGLKTVSAFRVIHFGHFIEKLQLAGTFRELWLVLAGMADTMRTVGWVVAILLLVMWVFAIIVTMVVMGGGSTVYNYTLSAWTKDDYWGSVPKSLFSLFQVLTQDTWSASLVWPLVEANTAIVAIFILFLCIASLALMNTIVGVVVESTLRSARDNAEKEARERLKADQKILSSLELIFREADGDLRGQLGRRELHAVLAKPRVRRSMRMLGIPVGDLDLLFSLLDEEGKGNIRTDMFFRGCTRLRGPAMARDLQHMAVDLERHHLRVSKHIDKLGHANNSLANLLDMIDVVDTEIVTDTSDVKDPVLQHRKERARVPKATYLRNAKGYDGAEEANSNASRQSSRTRSHDMFGNLRASAMDSGDFYSASVQPDPPPLPAHLARRGRHSGVDKSEVQ